MKTSRLFVILLTLMCFASVWGGTYGNACAAQVTTDSIIAPNVFTPNGDGENEFFEVTSREGKAVALKVFTRAGVLVFSITAKTCKWDGCSQNGDEMAQGVYFYTAEVPGSSPKVSKSGFVHLFR
ncbi:MAG: gliding motility-associated C-terminal domain-containing protein [Bacteroidales bacterium]|nr:gliding motility-associated C-terminal domain-containing protein [Bacteroidales bacterium]